jgi:hypothetical protein
MRRWLRHIPNVVSSVRILLVVPIALAIARHDFVRARARLRVAIETGRYFGPHRR